MHKSKLKLEKELKREERHREWIRKNLLNTDIDKKKSKEVAVVIH